MASDDPINLTAAEEQALREACKAQWIDDVPSAFADIPTEGTKLQVHTRGEFPNKTRYTKLSRNADGNENHFQGCARLPGSQFLVFAGGDWRAKSSHLFVAKLESRGSRKKWDSNIAKKGPPKSDRVIKRVDLATPMWHAGGIDVCGQIVAASVECGPVRAARIRGVKPPKCDPARSRILFLYMKRPGQPKILEARIDRTKIKATAVALAHVRGQGYVTAVLSAAQPTEKTQGKRIDFYRTAKNKLSAGFQHKTTYRIPKTLKWADYQTLNFVQQPSGQFFLTAMAQGLADLFKVTLPSLPSAESKTKPSLEFVARREFPEDKQFAEFKAGVGIYAHRNSLNLYAVPQWRRADGKLGFTEWAP
ncbi:MAG: hypothetical protein IIA27_15225 [Gemmatimonadetes bacterium]|nr:hypothetical protein [Gemmatimonadota bacterium]